MRLALAILGAALCLTHCGPARAQTASDAFAALCPTSDVDASIVDSAASEVHVPAVVLVAMGRPESSCGKNLINRRTHSYGFLQIKLDGSANVDHLTGPELLDPAVNIPLGARHLAKWMRMCGTLGGALTGYHGRKDSYHGRGKCDVDGYARKVLGLVASARRWIQKQRERTS
jgi:hypothetical protein